MTHIPKFPPEVPEWQPGDPTKGEPPLPKWAVNPGGRTEPPKLTDKDIREAMALIFDTVGRARANVFAGLRPMYREFSSLSPAEQEQGFQGLKDRISKEGLQGYVNRKREAWGEQATQAVIDALKAKNWW